MNLILDASSMKFQAGDSFSPRLDKDGVHRRDKQGGTNLPLYAVPLVVWLTGKGVETILVTVALQGEPPAIHQGQQMLVEGLQAMPWVQNGNVRVAYRASTVVPVNGSGPSAKPSPTSAN
ncbi:MAG: hypothetical protein ACRDRK_00730 [Pseudonocardia sp.]